MDIIVSDISEEEREEVIQMEEDLYGEPYMDALPTIEEYTAYDVASVLDNADSETTRELFGGTGIFVNFDRFTVHSADWIE
jgi:hypothetical protein